MSPRYDVPRAAPEPLRRVQLFLNSVDLHNGVDWLPDWLAEHGSPGELDRARTLREALRSVALANNGFPLAEDAVAVLDTAAGRVRPRIEAEGVRLDGGGDALDEVTAVALAAMLDGSFARLKACRHCRWSFYDGSPNRSATWCSMQLCGNRHKTRGYRRRRAGV